MSSSVNEEMDTEEDMEPVPDVCTSTQSASQGCGVIIKEEPEDSGYERVFDDAGNDKHDNCYNDGDDGGTRDDCDGPSSMSKTEEDESLDVKDESSRAHADGDDGDGEPISVVIKLEPEEDGDGSEAETDEDATAKPREKVADRALTTEGEQKSDIITTTVMPPESNRGLFKGDEIFQCEVCEKMYSSQHHLDVHQRTRKHLFTTSVALKNGGYVVSNTKERQFKCKICSLHLGSATSLRRHEKAHDGQKPFKCQHCDKKFARLSGCKEHEKRHSGIRPFKCKYCGRTFFTAWELKTHTKGHDGDPRYSCNVCLEKFPTESERDTHEAAHGSDNPLQCKFCDAAFSEPKDLSKHEEHHINSRKIQCSTCGKSFPNRRNYNDHQRIHRRKKNFRCKVCNYATHQQSLMDKHMRVHTGEKPYKCMYCQDTFSGLANCRRHERAHRGEKPYPCKFCNKAFVCSGSRKIHERLHTGEKPFKCKYCGKGFIKSYYRTVHERKHEEFLPQEEIESTHGRNSNGESPVETNLGRTLSCQEVVAGVSEHQFSDTETALPERDWNAITKSFGEQSMESLQGGVDTLASREAIHRQVMENNAPPVVNGTHDSLIARLGDVLVKSETDENVNLCKEEPPEDPLPVLADSQSQRPSFRRWEHHYSHTPGLTSSQHERLQFISTPIGQHLPRVGTSHQFVQQGSNDSNGQSEMESLAGHYDPKNLIRPSIYYPPPGNLVANYPMAPHLNGFRQIYFPPPSHGDVTGSSAVWQHIQQGSYAMHVGCLNVPPTETMFPSFDDHLQTFES